MRGAAARVKLGVQVAAPTRGSGRAAIGPAAAGYGDGGIDPEDADTYAMGAMPSIKKFAPKDDMEMANIDLEETEVPSLKRQRNLMIAVSSLMSFMVLILAYLYFTEEDAVPPPVALSTRASISVES